MDIKMIENTVEQPQQPEIKPASESQLKQRAIELLDAINKKSKVYLIIYFAIVAAAIIAVDILIFVIFGINPVTQNAVTIISVVGLFLSFSVSSAVVFNVSKTLKSMQREVDIINKMLYPRLYSVPKSKLTASKKFMTVSGMSLTLLGFFGFIITAIFFPIIYLPVSIILVLVSLWLLAFGIILALTGNPIRSTFYPTVTLFTLIMPPFISIIITLKSPLWIGILSFGLSSGVGICLFSAWMYFTIYRPQKMGLRYVEEHRGLFEEKSFMTGDVLVEFKNAKGDLARITFSNELTVEKRVSDRPARYEKIKEKLFFDYNNAYIAAVKELVKLYEINDGRKIYKIKSQKAACDDE